MTAPAREIRNNPASLVKSERAREAIADRAKRDLFYLSSVILGYDKLTVPVHGPLCRFFTTCPMKRRIMLMPRTHFKSTLITISGTIQDVVKDPNITILLAAATEQNAQRFLEEVKRHFMNNEVLRWLFPELVWDSERQAPRWNKQEMEVRRDTFVREPTVDTIGARGEVISRHYLKIALDDLIGEKEYKSQSEMQATSEWLSGVESLLVPPFEVRPIDIIGTRWKMDDTYAFAEYIYGGGREARTFTLGPHAIQKGHRLAIFSREVRENGEPIFPEMFSKRQLLDLQRSDPMRFAAQYLNNPLASGASEFELAWLKYYHTDEKGRLLLEGSDKPVDPRKLQIFILCDPSLGETKKSDCSAVITIGVLLEQHPKLIMLDAFIRRIPPDELIRKLFETYDKWPWARVVSLEAVAFQKALKYWIEQIEASEERRGKSRMPIVEYKPGSKMVKAERIKGLQPICRGGQLYIQEGFTDFVEEYQAWHPDAKRDDGMDSLAQILEYVDFGWSKDSWSQIEEFNRLMSEARDPLTGTWSSYDPARRARGFVPGIGAGRRELNG